MNDGAAEARLQGFIDKFDPAIARRATDIVEVMRAQYPGAFVLVYDNYNALAVGFGSGPKMADMVFSIAVYPKWVSLFIVGGQRLEDPDKLLKGTGETVRHIVLSGPDHLDDPGVVRLMDAAMALNSSPIPDGPPGSMVIKSVSAKQRPRRPA